MVLLFQPRSVFAAIEGGTPGGTKAREVIRRRLAAWDLAGLHPSLGDYGDPSNHEADQYFLPDDDSPPAPCPLVLRGAPTPASPAAAVTAGPAAPLVQAVMGLLPASGSVEVQRDPAGRAHPWHTHPVDEILFVVEGDMTFQLAGGEYRAGPGTRIDLPAGTPHSSVAGQSGCVYVIAVRA